MKTKRLTPNQRDALAQYPDVDNWTVPPRCQGRIVVVSYGCSDDYIFGRIFDQSNHEVVVTAYRHHPKKEFDPWNLEPPTGRRVGEIFRGHRDSDPLHERKAKADRYVH